MRDDDEQKVRPADGELREAGPRSLGGTLATARSAHSLSVQQLAAELRVEPALLLALEGERFDELGPAVFVRGYLKQYAHRLGLDYADLLRRYEQAADIEDMPIVHRSGTRWQENRRGARTVAVIAAVAVACVGAWTLWTSGAVEGFLSRAANGEADDVAPTGAAAAPASAPVSTSTVAPAGVQPAQPGGATTQEGTAADVRPGVSPEVSDARDSDVPDRSLAADAVDDTPAAAALPDAPVGGTGAVPEGHTGIVLSVSDDCWVEISDADGDRVFYGLARAGQTLTVDGRAPLSFLLGNASSVELEVDGQPYPLPDDEVIGNIARFTIAGRDGSIRQ
jgi:cytoskeleton protein RodZ